MFIFCPKALVFGFFGRQKSRLARRQKDQRRNSRSKKDFFFCSGFQAVFIAS